MVIVADYVDLAGTLSERTSSNRSREAILPRGTRMVVQVNPYGIVRRVLIAAITGALPEESRKDAIRVLTDALRAPDEDLRGLAIIGLCEVGGDRETLLPPLVRALRDPSETVRRRAARSLGDLAPDVVDAVPHLTAALGDPEKCVRLEVVHTLGRIGVEAEAAIPSLVPLLAEKDCRICSVVGLTLRRIGSASVPYLLALLVDSDPHLRERAVILLGRIGSGSSEWSDEVIASLLESCSDPEIKVRAAARESLERLNAA